MSGTPIALNVYDVSTGQDPTLIPSINSWIGAAGVGIFHSGVEIRGTEYCFGGHEDSSTGVFQIEPRTAPDARFRQAIAIGTCTLGPRRIQSVLDTLASRWTGDSYNLLARNCNHYADALCVELTGNHIPGWVNRLAFVGSKFSAFLPAGFTAPGAAPVTAAAANAAAVTRVPSGPPLTAVERRAAAERAAVAAEVRAVAAAASVEFDDPDHDYGRHQPQATAARYETHN
jgi:hypothetical protein